MQKKKAATYSVPNSHEGAEVLSSFDRKNDIGKISLRDRVPIVADIVAGFEEKEIVSRLIGGSFLGYIPVPDEYLRTRIGHRLVDVFVLGSQLESASDVMKQKGWEEQDPATMFSITYRTPQGETKTVCTIENERLFSREIDGERFYVNLIPVPTRSYSYRVGGLKITTDERLTGYAEALFIKTLRGKKQDIEDTVAIASVNDLSKFFESKQFVDDINANLINDYDHKELIRKLTKNVTKVIDALEETISRDGESKLIRNNIDHLLKLMAFVSRILMQHYAHEMKQIKRGE